DLPLAADVRAGDPDADAVDHAVQDAVLDVRRAADGSTDHHHAPAARRLRRAVGVRALPHLHGARGAADLFRRDARLLQRAAGDFGVARRLDPPRSRFDRAV